MNHFAHEKEITHHDPLEQIIHKRKVNVNRS